MKKHYYDSVIEEVCNDKHLTVNEIFEEILKKFPKAWKSSIYRNVDRMTDEWKLKKLTWFWNKAFFEKVKGAHIHLVDEATWEIFDFDISQLNIPNLPKNFITKEIDIKIIWNFEK